MAEVWRGFSGSTATPPPCLVIAGHILLTVLLRVAVLFKAYSLLLFTFTSISLLSFYKYSFELVRIMILLVVLEHAVHTFFVINLFI